MEIDCSACKLEKGMSDTKVPKFGGVVRLIGFIIAAPSFVGVALGAMLLYASGAATSDTMATATSDASMAGAAIGGAMTFGFSLFIMAASMVGGLIGWLLLMKQKVFKCNRCGFILPRS